MTQYEAVRLACREIGVVASGPETVARASYHYRSPISYRSVIVARCKFRKTEEGQALIEANKVGDDARTYKGQPRRDMRRDDLLTVSQVKRMATYMRHNDVQHLIRLIGDGEHAFHSTEQLLNALRDLADMQVAA